MNDKIHFPARIAAYTDRYGAALISDFHCSGDLVYAVGPDYILKGSKEPGRLERESRINDFLKGKLPVSESVVLTAEGEYTWYLKTCVKGDPLVSDRYLSDPVMLADLLAEAMKIYHGISTADCDILNADSEGDCFVHGDFCLPNILATDGVITGFIDTEASGKGDPWIDYAWCIWSYEHNLKTAEYTPYLLEKLGITFDAEKFERYTAI